MLSLLRIAARNVLRNRRRSLITLSAVFLALGIMTSIRGFLNGLQSTIRESVIYGQTGAVQVHKKGFMKYVGTAPLSLDVPSDDAFLARITAVPGVVAAAPRIAFGGMLNANDETAFALFNAVDPAREMKVCPRRVEQVSAGVFLDAAQPKAPSGVFSPELMARVRIKTGDTAALLTGDKDGVLNALDAKTVGVFGQPGIPLPEKKLGFVTLAFAQELLRMEGRATEVAVNIKDLDDTEAVADRLRAALGDEYEVSTWHDFAGFLDEMIRNQNFVLNFIAGIFLFVALLGIANTMVMSVLERTREIGTMMSVGVRRRQILSLFLVEAGLLGLSGGVLGGGLGLGLILYFGKVGMTLYFAGSTVPIHVFPFISVKYLLFIFSLATVGAVVAALSPALRASRLRPVEALAAV